MVGSEQCIQFMTECLSLIQHKLPPIAVEAMAVAREYSAGRISVRTVSEMLVKCWEYLKEHHPGVLFEHPEVAALRAVICLLHAQKHPQACNIVDHLSFFLWLVEDVESHREQEEALLRKHFAKCL